MPALNQRNIPNALTLLRLILAALTITLLSLWRPHDTRELSPAGAPSPDSWGGSWGVDWLLLFAAALFTLAAITDALDGYLARKWSAISIFGRIMDPFADKILVLGALIAMASGPFTGLDETGAPRPPLAGFTGWMVTLILARELLVTSIRGVYESRGIDFSATTSGKLKMMLQSGAIPTILVILALSAGDPPRWAALTITTLAWLTTLVTLWSAIPYITRALSTPTASPSLRGGPMGGPSLRGGPTSSPSLRGGPAAGPPDRHRPAESPLNDPESPLPNPASAPGAHGTSPPAERGATQGGAP
jgi:CDP-diacylglycerol--glycerol-3-phosphate 3-phosphatidyltransferase